MTSASSPAPSITMLDSPRPGNGSSLSPDVAELDRPMSSAELQTDSAGGARTQWWWLFNVTLPLAILCAGGYVVWLLGSVVPDAKPPDDWSLAGRLRRLPAAAVTQTLSLSSVEKPLELRVDGVVVPFREVQIATEVAGRIVKKSPACEAGSYVKQGELLVEIDNTDYQQEVDRLTRMREQDYKALIEVDQEIANTKRLVDVATRDVELQEREVKRLESMPAGFASQAELDRAKKALLTAIQGRIGFENQMQLLAARRSKFEAAERLATTELRGAEINLERTKIYSPVEGVVVREDAELNSFVQRGSAIITMEDISKAEVAVNLRMDQLQWVLDQRDSETGMLPPTADGITDSLRDRSPDELGYSLPPTPAVIEYQVAGRSDQIYRWNGTLMRYAGIGLDPRSRTVPVVVVVDQPRKSINDNGESGELSAPSPLVRGMFVNVKLLIRPQTNLVAIPSEAIQPGNRVWQFVPDDSVLTASTPPAEVASAQATTGEGFVATPTTATSDGEVFKPDDWVAGRVVVRKQVVPVDALWLPADGPDGELPNDRGADAAGPARPLQERRYWVCEVPGGQLQGGDWVVYTPLGNFEDELAVRVSAGDLNLAAKDR